MRSLPSLFAALFLCLGSPLNLLLATDYFVIDNGGPTGGDGSLGSPWGTITEALGSGSLSIGDTLNVAAGNFNATDGEAFPLTLPDGVTLQGAGMDQTAIDGSGVGTRVIEHLGNSQPSAVAGVEIQAGVGNTAGVTVTNNVLDFNVRDCRFLGGRHAVEYLGFGSGPIRFTLAGNTISTNSGRAVFFDHNLLQGGFSDDLDFKFKDNVVSGGGTMTEGVLVDITAGGLARAVVIIEDNTFSDLTRNAIQGGFRSSGGFLTADYQVLGNTVTNAERGIAGYFSASSSGTGQGNVLFEDNVIDTTTKEGMVVNGYAGFFTTVWYQGTISGNTVTGAGNEGYSFAVSTTSSAFAFAYIDFLNNKLIDGGQGIGLNFFGFLGGISSGNVFHGNVITGNEGDGIEIGFSSASGGDPDFGNGTIPGRNTIENNALLGTSLVWDFDVQVWNGFNFPMIDARGNFWGTQSLLEIEDRVFHGFDSSTYEEIDYSNPLRDTLRFHAGELAPAPGHRSSLVAKPGCAFVPFAGNTPIEVTVNGIPATDPVVSIDGRVLKFTMPAGPSGDIVVTVTNPGGQTGSLRVSDRATPAGTVLRRG